MYRTYDELIRLNTYDERLEYLRLSGIIGESTFGFDRYINQSFYHSREWRSLRDEIIIRDGGCDMALSGYDIGHIIIVHHMNPVKEKDLNEFTPNLLNPNGLVCVSHDTHNAIHFGWERKHPSPLEVRKPNDTIPWR